MSLFITNSLTGKKEKFKPITPNSVSIYFCGLTVSDLPHLGHARAWVHVDVMRRWLEYLGFSVTYVENFTDINEKIVARLGESDCLGCIPIEIQHSTNNIERNNLFAMFCILFIVQQIP